MAHSSRRASARLLSYSYDQLVTCCSVAYEVILPRSTHVFEPRQLVSTNLIKQLQHQTLAVHTDFGFIPKVSVTSDVHHNRRKPLDCDRMALGTTTIPRGALLALLRAGGN